MQKNKPKAIKLGIIPPMISALAKVIYLCGVNCLPLFTFACLVGFKSIIAEQLALRATNVWCEIDNN